VRGLLLAFLMLQGTQIHAANEADLVIKNAQIFTASQTIGEAEAVAIKDGRFIAVGTNDEVQRYVGPDSTIIDASGKSVLPGFIDSHIHISSGTAYVQGLDLFGISKKSNWLEMIRLSAKNVPEGKWLIGGRWDHTLENGVLPLASDIDSLGIDTPVALVDIDGHSFWVNSVVLDILEIKYGKDFYARPGVQLDPISNLPNGLLFEDAMDLLYDLPEFSKQLYPTQQSISNTLKLASSLGITSIHDMSSISTLDIYRDLGKSNSLPLRIVYGLRSDCEPKNCSAEFLDLKDSYDYFDADKGSLIKVGFFKITIDGVLSTRTASLLRPYEDAPYAAGKLLIDAQTIDAYVKYLNADKIPLAIHAIGDKAVKTALNSFEKMGLTSVGNRIEHIELIDLKDVNRFKALGVYPSMQPNHGTGVIGKYIEDRVGNRDKFTYMWNTLNKKSEGNLLLGSDWPTAPLSPLTQIADAVLRESPFGLYEGAWFPKERLDLDSAIKSYTLIPAIAAGIDNEVGSIEVGKWADFVILDAELSLANLKEINIDATYLAGKLTYKNYD
jgi:predicted amidohydrolase YtcJ